MQNAQRGLDAEPRPGNAARPLPGIEVLRALAATLVLAHHTLEESNQARNAFSPDWLTTFGAGGVDIFFVISGFVMYYTCYGRSPSPPSPTNFMIRRILRIYPLYWLACAGMSFLNLIGFHKTFYLSTRDAIFSLALLPSDNSFLYVGWTLVLEIYFYMVFAIGLLLKDGTMALLCTCGIILLLYITSGAVPEGVWKGHFGTPLAAEFCAGMVIAWLFSRQMLHVPNWLVLPAFAAMALTPLLVPHPDMTNLPELPRVAAWGIPACILVAGALQLRDFAGPVGRLLLRLGAAPYAIYLTHPFVMLAYAAALKRSVAFSDIPQQIVAACVMFFSIVVGLACHRLVEVPANTWIRLRLFANR